MNRRIVTVRDVRRSRFYMYPEIAEKEGLCSMLSVPMKIKEKVIGVINLYTADEHRFTHKEKNTLQIIANQAAIIIENNNLEKKVYKIQDRLETKRIVEKAKGILMKECGISEEQAYARIQKKAMNLRKPMKEVSEAIYIAAQININKES